MDTLTARSYRGYRFPREIIAHCVWLYFRFSLSFRDIQEMMLERGVDVSYEAIRLWCLKFGAEYAKRLRRQRGRPGGTWHLDEVFCKIDGELMYLWRAVDQSGEVLDVLVQKRRDTKAAKRFFRKLFKGHRSVPRAIVTDKLASYAAAKKDLMPSVAHHRGRPSSWAATEQSGRELAPAYALARTRHATIQINEAGPALSVGACTSVEPFSTRPPLYAGVPLSDMDDRTILGLV
jgi:putative transposase